MKKWMAELIGTFALVFAGTGAIVINEVTGGTISHVGIALTFGLVVLAMIYAVGDVSGAHLNPAVTLGFFAARRFEGRLVGPYIAAQCVGAWQIPDPKGMPPDQFREVRDLIEQKVKELLAS